MKHIFIGMWLSLVEHLVWDQGVAGSNPVIPTTQKRRPSKGLLFILPFFSMRLAISGVQ
jgi:hypothetical protein